MTIDGDDIGTWLKRQTQPGTWAQLLPEQRRRLTSLGITPAEPSSPTPAAAHTGKGPTKAQQAFQRGVTALAQWTAREGDRPVPRSHVEQITIDGETVDVKLGVWKSNTRSRIGKLADEQRQALRNLGVDWA
ncbi:helicase associated domain-containing protein [Streptomyces sp. 184]|uniref:helicase associated domain-containing protein n=1 Tax=Streptomyces sp. 184 TaxID=1827526 RepID=UPI003891458F